MLPSVQTKITSEEFHITDWASQIAELQARIAASQQRITQLNEDNAVADGVLQAAQAAKGKISDSEVIADLLVQLSQLLGGGDNPNGGNDGLPLEPAPQPNDDGGSEVAIAVELDQVSSAVDAVAAEQETVAIAVETQQKQPTTLDKLKAKLNRAYPWSVEQLPTEQNSSAVVALTGQHYEWATPLCCQLSDAPQSVLAGQSVEIACVIANAPQKTEYIELVPVSREVHYQRRTHDGEIICCYLGGNNKQKLKLWGEWLCNQHSVGSGFQLRESERLTAFKHEIKIWGMSLNQIQKLAETNTQKNPPSNFGTAPKRKIEPVAPAPKPLQIDDIQVGDTVRSTSIRNSQYKVLAKMENGMLDCERIGVTPALRLAVHPAVVELISESSKTEDSVASQQASIDIADVPLGVRLERTDDDLLTEYRVWAWATVRIFGKPEVQQKTIGILTETTDGISARRPHGTAIAQSFQQTFDAIKYLMQGASLKLADIEAAYNRHQEQIAIAAIPAVSSEQARIDLFGDTPVLADAFGGFGF